MGLSLPKSNLIFKKKCLDKWVHFIQLQHSGIGVQSVHKQAYSSAKTWGQVPHTGKKRFKKLFEILCFS